MMKMRKFGLSDVKHQDCDDLYQKKRGLESSEERQDSYRSRNKVLFLTRIFFQVQVKQSNSKGHRRSVYSSRRYTTHRGSQEGRITCNRYQAVTRRENQWVNLVIYLFNGTWNNKNPSEDFN